MRTESVMFFTSKEEEFIDLLIRIGTRRNIATALVFLANSDEVSSRQIERGTDLRQPEVSLAMRYLIERDWVTSRENESASKGRPLKFFRLAKPITEIVKNIEDEKRHEANQKIQLTKKLFAYV